MNKNLVQEITTSQIRKDLPKLESGDTVRVMVTIREGNKERQQAFEGVVISIRGKGAGKSFIVRKDSSGIGVERNFLLNSPIISSIRVLKHGKVRRKNLYYLRKRAGKSARLTQLIKDDTNLYPEIIEVAKEEPATTEQVEQVQETQVVTNEAPQEVVEAAKEEVKVEETKAEEKVEQAEAPAEEVKTEEVKQETPAEETKA